LNSLESTFGKGGLRGLRERFVQHVSWILASAGMTEVVQEDTSCRGVGGVPQF